MQLATLHFQISKNQKRQLYIIVTKVAVCAIDIDIDIARLIDRLLGNSTYRVNIYIVLSVN
jgi:hypothetical protein